MSNLNLYRDQASHLLASNLRKAFSGIVAGNVKEEGIEAVKKYGPYNLKGDPHIMNRMELLLKAFVEQKRMKLDYANYKPCYKLQ